MGHIDFVCAYVADKKCHIIAITETWLKPSTSDDLIRIDDYFLLRNDSRHCMGRGVACYVHNSLITTILSISVNDIINEPAFIIFNIAYSPRDTIFFTVIYRRPKGLLLNTFINEFCNYYSHYKNVIIAGDLNCDLLTQNFAAIIIFKMQYNLFHCRYLDQNKHITQLHQTLYWTCFELMIFLRYQHLLNQMLYS